jgi:membrane protease subunit (stomatin/prohibitin family)
MTLSIQRSPEASTALLERFENPQPPINSQLTVASDECVVVALNGAVLGVVPPGVHWLHPQPFPFLVPAIVGGNVVQAELWFVKTVTMVGLRFGGAVSSVTDAATNVTCTPRVMGTFALTIRDPVRVVQGCMGQGIDAEPLLAWAKQVVMRKLASALTSEVEGGRSILAQDLMPSVLERLPGELGELEKSGLAASHFGEAMLSFSDEDRTALSDASKRAVMAKLAAMAAPAAETPAPVRRCTRCGRPHDGGRFCVDCGGPLAGG